MVKKSPVCLSDLLSTRPPSLYLPFPRTQLRFNTYQFVYVALCTYCPLVLEQAHPLGPCLPYKQRTQYQPRNLLLCESLPTCPRWSCTHVCTFLILYTACLKPIYVSSASFALCYNDQWGSLSPQQVCELRPADDALCISYPVCEVPAQHQFIFVGWKKGHVEWSFKTWELLAMFIMLSFVSYLSLNFGLL